MRGGKADFCATAPITPMQRHNRKNKCFFIVVFWNWLVFMVFRIFIHAKVQKTYGTIKHCTLFFWLLDIRLSGVGIKYLLFNQIQYFKSLSIEYARSEKKHSFQCCPIITLPFTPHQYTIHISSVHPLQRIGIPKYIESLQKIGIASNQWFA